MSPRAEQAKVSDADLIKAYRAGDVHAFEELHGRYVGSIYRLVRRKLGDGLLAEDIAQETFMKTLRIMETVDDTFSFGGWVHTVARNLCFDELRRRQRDQRVESEEGGGDEVLAQLPSTSRAFDPVSVQESNELRRQVWAVAQRLPEKYRLVLTLRELQGLSYRRIARTLKVSESAIETLLYRARLRFKEEFVASEGGGDLEHDKVAPLLGQYLAGKLRRPQELAVRRHVAACVRCARKVGHQAVRNAKAT